MRIVVIGQAPFGEAVFKRLIEKGEDVVGVSAPATPSGGRPDPLRASAEEMGLPVLGTRDLKKPEIFEQFNALGPDLNVMAFVTDILKDAVLTAPKLGTIQYHPSILPKHRGASAMNWAIMQGDTETGLTVFWPDKGIDTGPILLQKTVEITPDDTLGSLYFGKLFPKGVDAMAEAVEMVRQGTAPRVAQDESQATYEGICKDEDAAIDWSRPAGAVYNMVRGCNPSPGAQTIFRNKALRVFDSKLTEREVKNAPGQVVRVDSDSFVIALRGGTLEVSRVQPVGEGKLKAADFITAGRINAGDMMGR